MKQISKIWDNFHSKNEGLLCAAQLLARHQAETNASLLGKEIKLFDKNLNDVSLYRKDGKFITRYHCDLYNKRIKGIEACPVFDISLQSMIQTEYNKEYKSKVHAATKQKRIRTFEMNLLNMDTAYQEFLEDYLEEAFFHQDKAFQLDDKNTQVIYNLIAYFTRQQDSVLNIKKGICLMGGVGTGKTTIMKQLSKFTKDKGLKTQFDFVYMDDLYSDCDSNGLEALKAYNFKSCSFDDIGMRAEINVNNYGTKINAYRELVRRQYIRFTRPTPSLSHYTTNIEYNNQNHSQQLVKTFGARELDRFREMCNFVELGGMSRRTY